MTYEEALAFWYGRIDYERRAAKPDDLKLDRMRRLLELLGNPEQSMRIVHVAGTKGKGSTSAMLAQVLRDAGYRVGLFTSPHLSHVEERIQVDGQPITHAEVAARMAEIRPAVECMERTGDVQLAPTFFEVGTALGLMHFICRQVEIVILEVGLGGRFDSTNVITPLISVITSISFDHMAQLGNTIALIAREKAGIIKSGRPVISGAAHPDADAVVREVASSRHAPLAELGRDTHYRYYPALYCDALMHPRLDVRTSHGQWHDLQLKLLGEHQAANAALVIMVVEELRRQGLTIPESAVRSGLARVTWPARLEVLSSRPWVILDCAHNVASVEALVSMMQQTFPMTTRCHLVFAASADKEIREMLQVMSPHFQRIYLTRYRNNPRVSSPEMMAEMLQQLDPHRFVAVVPEASDAVEQALAAAAPDDLVMITGSVFLAGELRPWLLERLR